MKRMAMRTASNTMSKQSAGDCGATMATGHSPLRPNIACNRSACSVLVGKPVLGPPRCTSMMTSGQFGHDGQADGLGLEADARSAGAGDAHGPAERGADGHADGGDLVLGLQGANAETLHLGQVVQDVRLAGVIG